MGDALFSNPPKKSMPTVLILAGGMGTRLKSVLDGTPKPLAPAGEKPFLYYLLKHLADLGFREFVLSLQYEADQIINYVSGNPLLKGLSIKSVIEPKPLQTGGAILWAALETSLERAFLVVNGDTLLSGDLSVVCDDYEPGQIRIGLSRVPDNSRYGSIELDPNGKVLKFIEKNEAKGRGGIINAGVYFLDVKTLSELGFGKGESFSIEKQVFPLLAHQGKIIGVEIPGTFIDIGVPEDYLRFRKQVES